MSDTPRTDEFIGNQDGVILTPGEESMCEFARSLERELSAVTAERDEIASKLETLTRLRPTYGDMMKAQEREDKLAAERDRLQLELASWRHDCCCAMKKERDRLRESLNHIAHYPNITAGAMRDCARAAIAKESNHKTT
jgi:hypothetical protein